MYCKHLNQLRFRPVFDIKSNNKAVEPLTDEDQNEPHDNDPRLTLPVSLYHSNFTTPNEFLLLHHYQFQIIPEKQITPGHKT